MIKIVARVKDKGWNELQSFKNRVLRQQALSRIGKADADWLLKRIAEIERRLIVMDEKPELEREFM